MYLYLGVPLELVPALEKSAADLPEEYDPPYRLAWIYWKDGKLDLEPGADRSESVARLLDLPGVGDWTAGYVAMRAIGDPDVFLRTDVAVRRGARALGLPDSPKALAAHAERWRPWRSYAAQHLWASLGAPVH